MIDIIVHGSCPVCKSPDISYALTCTDHTVSRESFEIWECEDCTARFTQNSPTAPATDRYYEAEGYISHTDTRKGIINRMYHRVRKVTLAQKRKKVKKATGLARGRLLDIGAGTGAFLSAMQLGEWKVTGLEPNVGSRKRAKDLYGLDLLPAREMFDLKYETYDAITMWHVLEHVHELHSYVGRISKLLKPQGRFIFAVPNYTSYDARLYKEWWAAYDVPRHLYHFSPRSVERLLGMHGMKLLNMEPLWFDSFYIAMLSEQHKNGSVRMLPAFLNGLITDIKTLGNVKNCSSLIYTAVLS